jgi:hypothetical protein
MAPARTLVSSLSACRRGIGLARMRAASSTRLPIFPILSRVRFNHTPLLTVVVAFFAVPFRKCTSTILHFRLSAYHSLMTS